MFTIHLIWAHATLEHLFPSISYWNNSVSFHLSMFFFPLQYVMNSHIMLIYLYLIWNTKYPTAETTVGLYWYNYCALNLQKKTKTKTMSPKLVYFRTGSLVSESCGILLEEVGHYGMAWRLEGLPEYCILSVWLLDVGKMWSDCSLTARLAP